MGNENNIVTLINKVRSDAQDIVDIIEVGIKPLINEDSTDFEKLSEKLDYLFTELFKAKDNLSKDFISLKRKI